MSIRTKLILSFLAAIVVAIGSISFLVSYQLGGFAERDFKVNSLGRLKLVNEFLIKFFAESEHGVAYLASLGDIQSAKGAVPSYLGERSPKRCNLMNCRHLLDMPTRCLPHWLRRILHMMTSS